jgi:protein-S-isoprenylcysteine O-methyltransferase Ste14
MEPMILIKAACFLLGTALLAFHSRASLAQPRSHGFARFLSWEAILGLLVLNIDVWFRDPFAWYQLISWVLLTISIFLVIAGVRDLKGLGTPDARRDDASLVAFERTTILVTTGAFRYIRHPMYSSLLFLAWGIFFKAPSWLGGLLVLVATLFLWSTARVEETENIRFFDEAYEEYKKRTKMFIPFLF